MIKICSQDLHHPELLQRIKQLIPSCHTCQTCKIQSKSFLNPVEPILAKHKGDIISMDLMGKLPTSSRQFRYILVIIDNFTKLVRLYPLRKNNTVNITRAVTEYIEQEGKPNIIICDQGTQFTSSMWEDFTSSNQLNFKLVPIRHHDGNITERAIRTLEDQLRCYLVNKQHKSWEQYIEDIEYNMNKLPHDTTEYTPEEAHREIQTSRPWSTGMPDMEPYPIPSRDIIHRNIARNRKQRLKKLNQSRTFSSLAIGDLVLIDQTTISDATKKIMAKLLPRREGPWIIDQISGKNTYVLADPESGRRRGTFHINQLYSYIVPRHELLT
uniref:Integrase catalytic domain-containing protein n=1 Tax=Lygus hesperus TaxID=30085 RepID=A0A0A9X7J9_LYGHE